MRRILLWCQRFSSSHGRGPVRGAPRRVRRADLRIAHVLTDGVLDAALAAASREARAGGPAGLASRRARAGAAVLRRIAGLAARAGVAAETAELVGDPADMLLADADRSGADILVLGRGDQAGDRRPAIGTQARRVLEFAQLPVLLVPPARDGGGEHSR
jgi:nucleotide-binding universal stress UspA family protein